MAGNESALLPGGKGPIGGKFRGYKSLEDSEGKEVDGADGKGYKD
jgi:hypothetical protein